MFDEPLNHHSLKTWLLPEGLADILPAEARRVEELRRKLLDLYRQYGFELVAPPLIEYIDSLLSGTGNDLDLSTCKLVDQLSGRMLGIRADMTGQVTRIDAHLLNRAGVTRLCYCGPVLHARPADLLSSRELLQVGAEIYGHSGVEADIEIIRLALATVDIVFTQAPYLDLCHPGVLQAILQADSAAGSQSGYIRALLREKDTCGLSQLREKIPSLRNDTLHALESLITLYGNADVLQQAQAKLPDLPGIKEALESLKNLIGALPDINISVDLADVGAYGYHSGITFTLYIQDQHDGLVRGGRYDNIGRAFGRARPATGFSLDLRKLASILPTAAPTRAIRAPWGQDSSLIEMVQHLRAAGEIVIQILPGHNPQQDEFICDRELVWQDTSWKLVSL